MNTTKISSEFRKNGNKSVTVNVHSEHGIAYIIIYEVYGHTLDGRNIVSDRFLSEVDAERKVDFNNRLLKNIYEFSFIQERYVWC